MSLKLKGAWDVQDYIEVTEPAFLEKFDQTDSNHPARLSLLVKTAQFAWTLRDENQVLDLLLIVDNHLSFDKELGF